MIIYIFKIYYSQIYSLMKNYQKKNLIVQENKPNIKLFYYLIDKIPS